MMGYWVLTFSCPRSSLVQVPDVGVYEHEELVGEFGTRKPEESRSWLEYISIFTWKRIYADVVLLFRHERIQCLMHLYTRIDTADGDPLKSSLQIQNLVEFQLSTTRSVYAYIAPQPPTGHAMKPQIEQARITTRPSALCTFDTRTRGS